MTTPETIRTITRPQAERIYDEVLVPICGADPRYREAFVINATATRASVVLVFGHTSYWAQERCRFDCDTWTVKPRQSSQDDCNEANAALARIRTESTAPTTSPVPAAPASMRTEAEIRRFLETLNNARKLSRGDRNRHLAIATESARQVILWVLREPSAADDLIHGMMSLRQLNPQPGDE